MTNSLGRIEETEDVSPEDGDIWHEVQVQMSGNNICLGGDEMFGD